MPNHTTIIVRRPNNGAPSPRKKRTPKTTIEEAHRIARAIERRGGGAVNPYAVGMAVAKAEPLHPFAARMAAARAAAKRSGAKKPKKPRKPTAKKTAAAKPKKPRAAKPKKARKPARARARTAHPGGKKATNRPKSAPFMAMAKKLAREGFSSARANAIAAQRERASYAKRRAKK
jgi:hypothetical protein